MSIATQRFPVLSLELLRLAKLRSLYGQRLGVTSLLLALLAIGQLFQMFGPSGPEGMSRFIAGFTMFVMFAAAILAPLVRAPEAMLEEKSERTLGLLLITNVSSFDIVFAKFATFFLETELLILSTLPVMAFAAIFGGVSVVAVSATFVLLSAWVFMVTAIGVMWSVLSGSSMASRILTIASIGVWYIAVAAVFVIGGFSVNVDPISAAAGTNVPSWPIVQAIPALIVPLLVGVSALLIAAWSLPKQMYAGTGSTQEAYNVARREYKPGRMKRPLVGLLSASSSSVGLTGSSLPMRILAVPIVIGLAIIPGIGMFVLLILLYREVTLSVAAMKSSGALDELLLLPKFDSELRRAVMECVTRGTWVFALGVGASMLSTTIFVVVQYLSTSQAGALVGLVGIVESFVRYGFMIVLGCYYGFVDGWKRRIGIYIYFMLLVLEFFMGLLFVGIGLFSAPIFTYGTLGWGYFLSALAGSAILISLYLTITAWHFSGLKTRIRMSQEPDAGRAAARGGPRWIKTT